MPAGGKLSMRRVWWERPRLRVGEEDERRVSWLELFFDLVFVVIVSQLAHILAQHVSWDGLATYSLLFVAAWWTWIGGTFYNERFETHDISYRLFVFLQILAVAGMAVFAHDGTGKLSEEFALSYIAARVLIVILWARGGWHNPLFRPVSNRYVAGFVVSIVLWSLSILVSPPLRFALWAVGLTFDLVTPMTTLHLQSRLPRSRHSKLPERFGLFVIIVLGEAMVGVISGLAAQDALTLTSVLTGAFGLALVFGLWWIYFDFIGRRNGAQPSRWWSISWNYLHLPLVMSVAALSAAVQNLVAQAVQAVAPNTRWLMAGAVAVALLTLALIEAAARREADEPAHPSLSPGLKLAGAGMALAVGALGAGLTSPQLMVCLVLPLLVQMAYGAYAWYSQELPAEAERPEYIG